MSTASAGKNQPLVWSPPAQAGADMADGALWLYHLAFQELQRSIATECWQRGELLGACWCAAVAHPLLPVTYPFLL